MTPDQRKELGINKSTLWYIQKNLREGKKVKLYNKVKAKMGYYHKP
jgi:CRISPR-associated protein Cas1